MTAATASWCRSIMLGTGWALIDARIGSRRSHSHVAHKISLAVERDLEVSGDDDVIVPAGHAIAIASHIRHRLGPEGGLVRVFLSQPAFSRRRESTRHTLDRLVRHMKPTEGDVILDIGSGTGNLALSIARHSRGVRYLCIDPDEAAT